MTLGTVQSIMILVLGAIAVIVLLYVLVIVHKQTGRVKELEMRMKAMDELEVNETTEVEVK